MDPIDQIKAKIDIVDLISEYFPLKKMGRNFAALCPFHKDSKPSFMVSPDRQIFRCFSCEKRGDIFAFIQEKEGLDFRESLEFLAKKAGVTLPRYDKKARDEKEKLFEINQLAAKLYHHILLNTRTGALYRKYLQDRKIDKNQWVKFYLGASPRQSILAKFLQSKGFTISEIAQSGLLVAGEPGKFFDRFFARIIFPIFDVQGRIVGFSGRVIDEKSEPKYLNSPETPIFQKGSHLFGLNLAKEAIKGQGFAILTEGEFDVIASHGAGIENVVAVKGTSLTENQVNLLCRFCDQISICFDMDLAGDAAARRGIELADSAGLSIKVIQIPGAKDPDEAVKKSPNLWKKAIAEAIPVYDWLIVEATRRYDAASPYGAKKITDEITPIMAAISDEVVKAHYFQKLAARLAIAESALWEKAARFLPKKLAPTEVESETKPAAVDRLQSLSEYFLALILQGAAFVKSRQFWPELNFIHSSLRNFYQEIIISTLGKANFDLKSFTKAQTGATLPILDNLLFINLGTALDSEVAFGQELTKVWQKLCQLYYKEKIASTLAEIKQAKQEKRDSDKLTNNLNFLLKQLASLQKGVN